MSTEVKTHDEAAVASSTNGAVPAPGHQTTRLWRRRRYQASAIVIFTLVVAVFGANNYLAGLYTPEGAVRQYLTALQSGDSSSAWSAIQVQSPASPAAVSLTDESALRAALSSGESDLKSFTPIGTTKLSSALSSVAISYATSSGTNQSKLLVQRSAQTHFGIYPGWQILVVPTLLQINLPTAGVGIKVDGRAVTLPAGKSMLAVLPLQHRLDFLGTDMFKPQTLSLNDLFQAGQAVPFKPTLTDAGLAQVKTSVKAAFVVCSQQTVPYHAPDSACPQSADASAVTGQWSLFGDPTQDLSVTFGRDLNPAATGHYQMVFSYQRFDGLWRVPAGGAYAAQLSFSASGISVGSIAPAANVQALERPAGATDDLAKSLVSKAMTACAATSRSSSANCPQQLAVVDVSDLHWSITGDPLASAVVTFDGSTGIVTVHGNFAMTASYKSFGTSATASSFSTAYNAYLLWDGQTLQLISIVAA